MNEAERKEPSLLDRLTKVLGLIAAFAGAVLAILALARDARGSPTLAIGVISLVLLLLAWLCLYHHHRSRTASARARRLMRVALIALPILALGGGAAYFWPPPPPPPIEEDETTELERGQKGESPAAHQDDLAQQTVYITKTGEKYHREGCSYLKSSIPVPLAAAAESYLPCSKCKPPRLTDPTPTTAVSRL